MTDAIDIDVPVTAKEWTPPPAWRCVICEQDKQPSRWRSEDVGKPPVCRSCANHWSKVTRLPRSGVSRADMNELRRLDAVRSRLDWETKNGGGRFAARYNLTAY